MNYSEQILQQRLNKITGLHTNVMDAARKRQAELAKPPGSLGILEDLSVQLAGITGHIKNHFNRKELLIFCADNGVVEEGISSAPQSVTLAQTVNLLRKKTGASVIAEQFGCHLCVCDVGIHTDVHEPAVINQKIAYGTNNIAKTSAMTREQAVKAIMIGWNLVYDAVQDGADIIGIGEMGIGNTTTASAVLAVLTDTAVKEVTGRGGGITDENYRKKIHVIETAIKHNHPDKTDVIDVLSKVGGFDIAAMCGAFLGAAQMRISAVIDGFISVVAALCAVRLCPTVQGYLIPSHASYEIGYRVAIDELHLQPLFDLKMRLGEGSGCPIAMMMLEAACAVMNNMATFAEANINDDYLIDIRKEDAFTVKGD